jgi:hypothetical protein
VSALGLADPPPISVQIDWLNQARIVIFDVADASVHRPTRHPIGVIRGVLRSPEKR